MPACECFGSGTAHPGQQPPGHEGDFILLAHHDPLRKQDIDWLAPWLAAQPE
jgi:hypothetical protein